MPDEAHDGQNVTLNCQVFSWCALSSEEGSSLLLQLELVCGIPVVPCTVMGTIEGQRAACTSSS